MFMDLKTEHSKDVSSPQIDTQVHHNSHQNTRKMFGKYKQDYSKSYMGSQRN